MLTPLGEIGIKTVANDDLLPAVQAATGDKSGFFFFPAVNTSDPNDMTAYDKKAATAPSGLIIYHPAGQGIAMSPATLGAEFVRELVQSLIAAFLLSLTTLTAYLSRVGFLSLIGVSGSQTTNVSYVIWYGFPLDYTAAYMTIEIVGALVAALVIAAIVRPKLA